MMMPGMINNFENNSIFRLSLVLFLTANKFIFKEYNGINNPETDKIFKYTIEFDHFGPIRISMISLEQTNKSVIKKEVIKKVPEMNLLNNSICCFSSVFAESTEKLTL